jgi:hypothetical protein
VLALQGKDAVPDTVDHVLVWVDPAADASWMQSTPKVTAAAQLAAMLLLLQSGCVHTCGLSIMCKRARRQWLRACYVARGLVAALGLPLQHKSCSVTKQASSVSLGWYQTSYVIAWDTR